MTRKGFWSVAMVLCGVAAAMMVPGRAHSENLIGTGVVGWAGRAGQPQNIQVISGDAQTGEAIAEASTGTIVAGLYNGTWVLLTPDGSSTIATLYQASPESTDVWTGTIQTGELAGAQITTELLGALNEVQWQAAVDVQWNGGEVRWETVDTTISSYNPN